VNLGDLLSELREGILHDFSDQVSGASDQLWSDERLVRYIDEAHRRFAREALVIRDGVTAQCCQITTVIGQTNYPLDKSVIAVLSVRMAGDNTDLPRAGHSDFDTYREPDSLYFNPSQLASYPPGKALAYDTDETMVMDDKGTWSGVNLRLFPGIASPYGGIIANMRVIRLPLQRLRLDNLDATPEVPEDYHLDMLDWAAYLALRIVDLDEGQPDRAKDFKKTFEEHIVTAQRNMKRKIQPRAQWAFGRNGFSWESN
jgi:hypothetical protein